MKKQIGFISIEQTGYAAAKAGDEMEDIAAIALDNIPDFQNAETIKDISDEVKVQVELGARKRHSERYPAVEYAVVNNNYIRMDALDKDAKVSEKLKIGVDYAFSMSQQEVGGLKESNPPLHAIVSGIRTKCNKYCNGRFKALFSKVQELKRARRGEQKTRQQALPMDEWLNKFFDDAKSRVVAAEARGDVTANKKRLGDAIIAFKAKYFV